MVSWHQQRLDRINPSNEPLVLPTERKINNEIPRLFTYWVNGQCLQFFYTHSASVSSNCSAAIMTNWLSQLWWVLLLLRRKIARKTLTSGPSSWSHRYVITDYEKIKQKKYFFSIFQHIQCWIIVLTSKKRMKIVFYPELNL